MPKVSKDKPKPRKRSAKAAKAPAPASPPPRPPDAHVTTSVVDNSKPPDKADFMSALRARVAQAASTKPVPRIEVWNYDGFARELWQRGVDAVRCDTARATIAANFAGVAVLTDDKLPEKQVRIVTTEKEWTIQL